MACRASRGRFTSRIITTVGRRVRSVLLLALALLGASISADVSKPVVDAPTVHALFELSAAGGSPFPSDRFTVPDSAQNTGRRIALPMPADCTVNRSDCNDITVLNQLDGFNQHPRVSIPLDGDIDPGSITRETVFIVSVPNFDEQTWFLTPPQVDIVPLTRIVWDPETRTLHARSDEALQEHSRYAIVVTRGVRDANGQPIGPSESFLNYRHLLATSDDPELIWYRDELIQAEHAARIAGVHRQNLAALSPFHTQSSTYLARQIHEDIFAAAAPAPADFNIGPGGSRAVYALADISSVTFNQQTTTGSNLSPAPGFLNFLRFVPGAIGKLAFGRYQSPNYRVHPGEYIPAVPSGNGSPVRQSTETIYFNLYLPSGPMPAGGWPVAIVGHGSSSHKNFLQATDTSYPASRGVAWLMINTAGHGYGALGTLRFAFTDGASVELPAGGRSIDQNGDGLIAVNEGFQASGVHTVRDQSDGYVQTAADLMQLVRVIQMGVDVDGDGQPDLDASRITYWGWSLGSNYGTVFFATTPQVRAAVFSTIGAPTMEHRRLSTVARPDVARMLDRRTPSLLNSDYGLTSIDGVPVGGPFFNENQPLRNDPLVVNTVPGAVAIQDVLERYAWAGRNASPAAYAPLVRLRAPEGQLPRPVLIQMGRGDRRHQNPGTSELVRAAALQDRTWLYRHDLFYPTMPPDFQTLTLAKDAHAFWVALGQAPWRPIVIGAQQQASEFLASDGLVTIHPTPVEFWEVPAVLSDDLGYIR